MGFLPPLSRIHSKAFLTKAFGLMLSYLYFTPCKTDEWKLFTVHWSSWIHVAPGSPSNVFCANVVFPLPLGQDTMMVGICISENCFHFFTSTIKSIRRKNGMSCTGSVVFSRGLPSSSISSSMDLYFSSSFVFFLLMKLTVAQAVAKIADIEVTSCQILKGGKWAQQLAL